MESPQKPNKAMSSRLLTMKFMQRAAASSVTSSPDSSDSRARKRKRESETSSPQRDDSDFHAVQAALAAEELKRSQALERQALEAGDTKWILNFKDADLQMKPAKLNVVNAGYGAIDRNRLNSHATLSETEDDNTFENTKSSLGRKNFGNFTSKHKSNEQPEQGDEANPSEDSNDERGTQESSSSIGNDHSSDVDARKKASKRQKKEKRQEHQEQDALQAAERRCNEKVKLNQLTSISGASGRMNKSSTPSGQGRCFNCGSSNHMKKDCPKMSQSKDKFRRKGK